MAIEYTEHSYEYGQGGDSTSQWIGVCPAEDADIEAIAMLGTVDPVGGYLYCKKVSVRKLGGDQSNDKRQLVGEYVPKLAIEALSVDMPFKWKKETMGEAVTVQGGYKWKSDKKPLLNRRVLPVKRFAVSKITLYGTRSFYDNSLYLDLIDRVNADTFLGAPPGTVFFESETSSMRMLFNGTIVYYVELHMIFRPSGWNQFWREDGKKPGLDTLIDNKTGKPIYESANFAPLLV